jgi:hypothetical protein
MSWVSYHYIVLVQNAEFFFFFNFLLAKWLGKDTITALAVDGKGGKAELLEKVARWVAASGRNVTQPGESAVRHPEPRADY